MGAGFVGRGLGTGVTGIEQEMITETFSDMQMIAERFAIERVLADYAYYLDMNMPSEMIKLFVEDCEVSYGPKFGAKGIAEYAKTLEGIGTFFKGTSHHNSGTVIDFVSPTEARTRTILVAVHRYAKEGKPDGILYGQYHDTLVKEGGSWKFKTRELRTTMTTDYHVKSFTPIGRLD